MPLLFYALTAVSHGIFHGSKHLRTLQHIGGRRRTPIGFVAGKWSSWINQTKTPNSHVFQGSGCCADIAWMRGLNQHHMNIIKIWPAFSGAF